MKKTHKCKITLDDIQESKLSEPPYLGTYPHYIPTPSDQKINLQLFDKEHYIIIDTL